MNKIRRWLINEFLPTYVKNDLLTLCEKQEKELAELKAKIREQQTFIRGLDYAMRRRITININDNRTPGGEVTSDGERVI